MATVNVLSDYSTAYRFKSLKQFELDLGKRNLKKVGANQTVMQIEDEFVKMVNSKYCFLISKFGRFCKISFYYSNYCEKNKVYVFFDEKENEIDVPFDLSDVEPWLSKTLYEIKEKTTNASN